MAMTDEQNAIIESGSSLLVVNALAGSGKSTTAKAWASARPKKKYLYLVFNKSAADKMRSDIRHEGLSNVEAMTIHSLAYRMMHVSSWGREVRSLAPDSLASLLGPVLSPKRAAWLRGTRLVIERFYSFCRSSSMSPEEYIRTSPLPFLAREECEELSLAPESVDNAFMLLWDESVHDTSFPLDHAVYLKLFHMERAKLPFDGIIVDEAQDLAPVTESIVSNGLVQGASLLLLGDTYQQLYSWNGSVNSMQRIIEGGADVLPLTKSFRCPDSIARKALPFLRLLGHSGLFTGMPGEVRLHHSVDAYLYRGNAGVFESLLHLGDRLNGDFSRVHMVGGVRSYQLDELADCARLAQGNLSDIKSIQLRRFVSFTEYERYCQDVKDILGRSRCSIVKRVGAETVIGELRRMKAACFASDIKNADYVISTGHKAKGQEFSRVHLGPDFYSAREDWERYISSSLRTKAKGEVPHDGKRGRPGISAPKAVIVPGRRRKQTVFPPQAISGTPVHKQFEIKAEEIRLLYVAMTRAAASVEGHETYIFPAELFEELMTSNDVIITDLDEAGNTVPYSRPNIQGAGESGPYVIDPNVPRV